MAVHSSPSLQMTSEMESYHFAYTINRNFPTFLFYFFYKPKIRRASIFRVQL